METISQSHTKKPLYKDFVAITKARLSISVVVSTLAGYLLGFDNEYPFQWKVLFLLIVGGYCMVGASNVFNQIIEKELDTLMDRTKNRPLPSGTMSKQFAFILGIILTILGLIILYNVNPKTAMFGAISIFMYVSLYTPLKTVTPLSVFVGALRSNSVYVRLGCSNWSFSSGNIIHHSIFLAIPTLLGNWLVFIRRL